MNRLSFDVEVYTDINKDGVETAFFCGDSFFPSITKKVSFKEMVDRFVGSYSNNDFIDGILVEDMRDVVKQLRSATEHAEKTLKALEVSL